MATPATVNPFNFYPGRDGLPLQNGYLYFGEPFQDPELQPLQAYWDDANTQPAARPIRTINGYPARNGAPAQVFVGAQYSMRVRDSQGREVFYAPNVTAVDLGGGGLDIITASGGQTVVTLMNAVYTPGSNAIDIALNGIIQISGQDYFETGTNRITMASALSAGDQIRAFARSTFGLTQAVLSDWQAEVFNGAGGGSQNFVLTRNPGAVANLDISVSGSTLRPLLDYTLSGNTVTITPAPAVGTNNVLIRYGRSLPQDALRGELASTASAEDGDALLGTKRTDTDAQDMTQHQRTEASAFTLHDCIPKELHASLYLGTNTTDLSPYIQKFLDRMLTKGGCGEIYGGIVYKCDNPVTLQRSSAIHATDLVINGNGARFDCAQLTGSESGLKVGATSTSYFLEKGSWTINDIVLLGPESVSPIGTSAPITTSIGLDLQYAAQITLNGVRAHDWYKGCKSLFVFPLQANRCNFRDNIIGLHLDEASNLQTWFETTLVECRYPLLIRSESTSLDSGKSNNITFVKYWTEGSVVGPVIDSGAGGGGAVRYRDIQFYSHYASGITYDMFRVGLQWTLATPQTRNANCSEFIEGLRIVDGVWNPGGGSFGATNAALCFDSVGRACNVFADIEIPSPDTDADVMIERPRNSTLRFRGAPGTFGQNVVSWMTNNDRAVVQRLNPNGTVLLGASKANSASVNETGIELAASGSVLATRDSDVPMRANRQTNDGYLFAAYRRDTLAGGMLTDQSTAKIIFMTDATNNVFVAAGTGTPESVVTAGPGSLFLRSDGGASTTLYVKTSGTGNTGWTAK